MNLGGLQSELEPKLQAVNPVEIGRGPSCPRGIEKPRNFGPPPNSDRQPHALQSLLSTYAFSVQDRNCRNHKFLLHTKNLRKP